MRGATNELIRRAAEGDSAALTSLLVRAHDPLLRYIRRRLPLDLERILDPEDALNETMILAFQQIGTLRADSEASFNSWLMTIAQNRLRNLAKAHRAKKRGGGRVPLNDHQNGDGEAHELLDLLARGSRSMRSVAGNREYVQLVRGAIEQLESEQRLVLHLRFVENLPHAQIAEQTGRSAGAVRQLCFRSLRRLRSLLPASSSDGTGR